MATSDDWVCPLCYKSSDNKKAHIRHTSYCRKKAQRAPRSRKRSCLTCIKAKSHCDAATSVPCSKCIRRGIECKFEYGQQEDGPVTTKCEPICTADVDTCCSSTTESSATLLADWNDASVNHISPDESGHRATSLVEQIVPEQTSDQSLTTVRKSPKRFSITLSNDGMDQWLPRAPIAYQWNSTNLFTLGPQLSLRPVKAFTPRGATWGRLSLLGRFMVETFRRYPYMMLSHKNTPPFVHRACLTNNKKNTHNSEPGPLLRCATIVELWRSKTSNSAFYFWKILRIEQERLMHEISDYEDLTAINALQAVTIYFLLRVSSTEDKYADFDIPLIQTMTQLLWRVRGVITAHCDPESPFRPNVCGWVMAESLRRTIAALFIIELLYDFSPAMINGRCNSLALWSAMLLPSSQQLWEADTQATWMQHYESSGDLRPYFGELLRHESLDHTRSDLLDRWMADVDDFGKLVINIASVAEVAC